MPNTFLKPSVIAATALGLLRREIVLPATVTRLGVADFRGASNDTVNIRVPGSLTARRRTLRGTGSARNIVLDNLAEGSVPIQLTDDIYSAVPITDEELTLDIVNFAQQVLEPQMRAVVEGLELVIASRLQSARPANAAATIVVDPAIASPAAGSPYAAFVAARKVLNDANVPITGRFAMVGSGIEQALLLDPMFVKVDQSGSDSALRDAVIGRIAGFDVRLSNTLGQDEGYVYHQSGIALATVAPVVPDGAPFGRSQTYENLALRWLRDYDFSIVQDRSLVDAFAGSALVTDLVNGTPTLVRVVRLQLKTLTIAVTPATATIAVGGTQQLSVTDANGAAVPPASVDWTTSNAARATVSSTGLVTGVATGSAATITATYQTRTATSAITVS